jgi:hypothetical protein
MTMTNATCTHTAGVCDHLVCPREEGRKARPTRRAQRTDAHRPGAIVPADYAYVMSYALASQSGGWPVPPIGIDQVVEIARAARADGRAVFGSIGKCGVCGAHYTYGDLWRHEPTGEIVHLGHDCADKYALVSDRQAFERELDGARVRSAREHVREMRAEKVAAFLAANEGLERALEADHYISRDLKAKLAQHGTLSEAQVKLAMKLERDVQAQKERDAQRASEVLVAAPQGKRITFSGTVVGCKVQEGQWGSTLKITVKVETEGGAWLAWGTCPSDVAGCSGTDDGVWSPDECAAWRAAGGDPDARTGERLRGRRVEITATLKPGREPHFAIMDRPRGKLLPR